jgi:mono/diheme cytochrome c family protein
MTGESATASRRRRRALVAISCVTVLAAARFAGDGVYTKEQAERGRALYDDQCASCHGDRLQGNPAAPLTGGQFLASWGRPNLTLDDLYYIIRKTMPKDAAGTLTRQEYADVAAYLLQQNGFAPGDKELTPDPELMKTVRFSAPAPPAAPAPSPTPR